MERKKDIEKEIEELNKELLNFYKESEKKKESMNISFERESECDDAELRKKQLSPFCYHKGLYYQRIRERGKIDQVPGEYIIQSILDILEQYEYLNSFLIRICLSLSSRGEIELSQAGNKKVLSYMVKTNMINRYDLKYKDDDGHEHVSVTMYCLRNKRLNRIEGRSAKDNIYSKNTGATSDNLLITKALHILSLNQFRIFFDKRYGNHEIIKKESMSIKKHILKYSLRFKDGRGINLCVLAIHKINHWRALFLEMLSYISYIKHGISNTQAFYTTHLLVICENESHAVECEQIRNCFGSSEYFTMYTTDLNVVKSDNVLSRVQMVEPFEEGGRNTYLNIELLNLVTPKVSEEDGADNTEGEEEE